MTQDSGARLSDTGHFDYFMIRVGRTSDPASVRGQVERLGTGQRQSFETGEQLVQLVTQWVPSDSTR